MSFTTPPRPVDVTALFPQLAPLARTATRLHPRPGSPTVSDSSVGGPLLWPADEPWPYCDEPHDRRVAPVVHSPDDIRLHRRVCAASAERLHLDPEAPRWTPEERETLERIGAGRPWFDGPIPLLPVAQLYARDVPFPCPPDADLLQVLWCPFDHAMAHPRTALLWRSSATVTDVLDAPPEPPVIQLGHYLPEPCLLSPEQVTDFPNPMELGKELRDQVDDMSRWESVDPVLYSSYAEDPQELYFTNLCHAPGWKTGGWTRWGLTDPVDRSCPECGTEAVPLLTIASSEWDSVGVTWIAEEEGTAPAPPPLGARDGNFTLIDIVGGYDLQLHVCPADPSHPHIELVQ
ncbi:hypothetical protein [Streptomyces chromofuscus]|uniref:DUF1963 domain-containing protein n=1 Tax=Streptomyces chromofuscus TaxID=42881 RepID=A0A7M2TDD5_STRCW|nr:hypothetical protein [Streptomyces chromofuscus]QOV45965.1 hypothetical protein IPT68_08660 [Streptomyces chromofuscus]GGT11640.1 hypothetical protein GCM10010254_35360 [Streptomyces chromofuscus]